MTLWNLPLLEIAIGVALAGALLVSQVRNSARAFGWGLAFCAAVLVAACLAWMAHSFEPDPEGGIWSVQPTLFGGELFALDDLSAPLVPLTALLHFLTALATGRTKMRRFSLSWSLAAQALCIAIFTCTSPRVLVGLLIAAAAKGYVELLNRHKPTRVYVVHMGLFVVLLLVGWFMVETVGVHNPASPWARAPLVAALLIWCGTVPFHCWVTDWFEHASFGNAILFVTRLVGVYAMVRLVLPGASDLLLQTIGLVSLVTAVYAAGMALVQQEARRFFAYLFISHASLVLVGLELHTPISLTGGLALWIAISLSLSGFGLTLRALEARFGRLSLTRYHGLYEHSPALAVCFLLTGLASVGFPGTPGFVAAELLVEGAIDVNPLIGLGVILTAALNGIAVVRVYFLLFTGTRHVSTGSLDIGWRERAAVLTLAALLFAGGLFPQPGVHSRYQAAVEIVNQRTRNGAEPTADSGGAGAPQTQNTPSAAGTH